VAKKKKPAKAGGGTPATATLAEQGVPYVLHPYLHDPEASSYGMEAAEKLGFDPRQVFKTLLADVDGDLVVAVVPVAGQLDLKALAAAVGGKKAVMADPDRAERVTGYVVGGISPIGQKRALPTVLDVTAMEYHSVLVSGGRRGLDIELLPDHLVRVTNARLAPIGRPD
jgi:Cys-tRNA(Pro)/Cys-tRNA(Cys) deacylase